MINDLFFRCGLSSVEDRIKAIRRMNTEEVEAVLERNDLQASVRKMAEQRRRKLQFIETKNRG